MKNQLIKLYDHLRDKGLECFFYEKYKKHYIFCNGVRITKTEEGYILSDMRQNRIVFDPVITEDDVLTYLTCETKKDGSLYERVLFIIQVDVPFLRLRRRKECLTKEERKKWHKSAQGINKLLSGKTIKGKEYIAKKICNLLESTKLKIVTMSKAPTSLTPARLKTVLPIPLDPLFLVADNLTVEELVIIETLTSFPVLIPTCLKISKGKTHIINIRNLKSRLLFKSSLERTNPPENWLYELKRSPRRRQVYDFCINFLLQSNLFDKLKTYNQVIWSQIEAIYGHRGDMSLLPPEFSERLKSFSLVVPS